MKDFLQVILGILVSIVTFMFVLPWAVSGITFVGGAWTAFFISILYGLIGLVAIMALTAILAGVGLIHRHSTWLQLQIILFPTTTLAMAAVLMLLASMFSGSFAVAGWGSAILGAIVIRIVDTIYVKLVA